MTQQQQQQARQSRLLRRFRFRLAADSEAKQDGVYALGSAGLGLRWWIQFPQLRPVRRLRDEGRKIETGRQGRRVETGGWRGGRGERSGRLPVRRDSGGAAAYGRERRACSPFNLLYLCGIFIALLHQPVLPRRRNLPLLSHTRG